MTAARKESCAGAEGCAEPLNVLGSKQEIVFVGDDPDLVHVSIGTLERAQVRSGPKCLLICQIDAASFVVRFHKEVQVIRKRIIHDFAINRFTFPLVQRLLEDSLIFPGLGGEENVSKVQAESQADEKA